jgi:hypothetical protein
MDGISSLALSAFETVQRFRNPPSGYLHDAVEVAVSPEDAKVESGDAVERITVELLQHQLPESRLLPWFQDLNYPAVKSIPEATFRAIRIDRELDVSLNISKDCFVQIFDAMRADPAVKYMICHDYDGFHEFTAQGYLTTRFIGTPIYAILWTFDPVGMATRALFIRRRLEPFTNFVKILRAFQTHIYTPWLPGFVSSYLMLQWSDRETSEFELRVIRYVEERTGFGPQPSGKRGLQAAGMEGKFDINVLTSWSQAVNEVSGNIGNKIRHQKISRTVLGMITEARKLRHGEALPDSVVEKHQHSLEELSRAVPLLERQLNTYLDYLSYLKDRAERLSAVVSAYRFRQNLLDVC